MNGVPLPIVLATDSALPSGVGEHMLTLAAALSPAHEITLCFRPGGDGAKFLSRSHAAGFETVALRGDFAGWLETRSPAILHVHAGIGWEGHDLVEAGWRAGVPVVRTEHLPYLLTDPEQQSRHRSSVNCADALVVVSDAALQSYQAEGFANVVTIRNGIETPVPRRTPAETRTALKIGQEKRLVVTVARFTTQKGHQCLLNAAADVSRLFPHVVFILVGDGPERAPMEALAASLDLSNVAFLGTRPDVPDLLGAADLFVLPSLFEGLPLVVLEAMALAVPIVATHVGGTIEALGGDHPFLVPPGESSVLATAITTALGDRPASLAVGIRERARFKEQFTAERMGRETASLYRKTMAQTRCAS